MSKSKHKKQKRKVAKTPEKVGFAAFIDVVLSKILWLIIAFIFLCEGIGYIPGTAIEFDLPAYLVALLCFGAMKQGELGVVIKDTIFKKLLD